MGSQAFFLIKSHDVNSQIPCLDTNHCPCMHFYLSENLFDLLQRILNHIQTWLLPVDYEMFLFWYKLLDYIDKGTYLISIFSHFRNCSSGVWIMCKEWKILFWLAWFEDNWFRSRLYKCPCTRVGGGCGGVGEIKNTYELLDLRALEFSPLTTEIRFLYNVNILKALRFKSS